jgi:hypothetical protein
MSAKSSDDKQPESSKGAGQQQQQQGGEGQQQQGGEGQEYGEGNYKATRQYNEGLKDHVEHHDIEKEARDAAPGSSAEEQEMEEAERIGKSRARGEGTRSSDDPEDEPDRVS